MMFLLFNKISLWLIYSLTISISFCISILFSVLGCHINSIFFAKHAPKWKYEQSISLLNKELIRQKNKLEDLQKK